ncbi:hypothetical protein ACFRIC_25370 [Streptomyces sp. NPDC056738]|uniref:hypothetical protein n=1 Tax=Streptomyces sp. NPDC056738 TaxID=3345933 RepID=UPI0036A61B3F
MRTSPGLPLRRAIAGRSAPATLQTPCGPASAEPSLTGRTRPANSSTGRRSSTRSALRHDPDLLGPGKEIRAGGDQLAIRIVSQRDAAWVGALFAAVAAKQ